MLDHVLRLNTLFDWEMGKNNLWHLQIDQPFHQVIGWKKILFQSQFER